MSAYIVTPETINQILSHLNRSNCYAGHAFKQMGYSMTDTASLQKLAQELYAMNQKAVEVRYNDPKVAPMQMTFRFVKTSIMQAYKSAKCLRYQCSEGDVFKWQLFQALESVCESIGSEIIHALPEYNVATWGA